MKIFSGFIHYCSIPIIIIGICGVIVYRCDNYKYINTDYDFVMNDIYCVSNAVKFGTPPDGYKIYCDKKEHYIVGTDSGCIVDTVSCMVRTNTFQAICAAWKYKAIIEGPSVYIPLKPIIPDANWQICN